MITCIVTLSGCNKTEPVNTDTRVITKTPSVVEESNSIQEEVTEILGINLNNEDSIREYLIGEWISDKENLSDYVFTESHINCSMIIDQDLNVNLSFYNRYTNETIGEYMGKINLDRLDENTDGLPGLISIDLGDAEWPGGDYFFLHRTIYDGKRVMSLFFAGNGNGIFDLLADIDNFEYAPEEILFEKTTGEKSQLSPLEDSEFYAVYWGTGAVGKSLWLDEVKWTPTEEYNPDALYPWRMTLYEDDLSESVLYGIAKDKETDILENPMHAGEVYFVQTDIDGNIIYFEDAAYKEYIETINKP